MSINIRSRRTHREILDVAWDLIAERGADVSMVEIARAAGISRQAVYVHFGSRAGLLMALVRRADERLRIHESFGEAMRAATPEERLDRWLTAWFEFVPAILPVARDLIRLRPTDPDAASAWEDRMTELRGWLRDLVSGIAKEDALRPDWTVEQATDYLWAASSVQMWALLAGERNWPAAGTADVLRQTLSATLLQRRPGAG